MSLNLSEQRLSDYIEANREERQFWQDKVRRLSSVQSDRGEVVRKIEAELWRYYVERAGVVPALREIVEREGMRRVSLRNYAEYLLRIWGSSRSAKKTTA